MIPAAALLCCLLRYNSEVQTTFTQTASHRDVSRLHWSERTRMGQQVWDEWEGFSPWLTSDEKNHQKAEQRKLRMAEIRKQKACRHACLHALPREISSVLTSLSHESETKWVYSSFSGQQAAQAAWWAAAWLTVEDTCVSFGLAAFAPLSSKCVLVVASDSSFPLHCTFFVNTDRLLRDFLGVSVSVENLKLFFLTLFCSLLYPMQRECTFV